MNIDESRRSEARTPDAYVQQQPLQLALITQSSIQRLRRITTQHLQRLITPGSPAATLGSGQWLNFYNLMGNVSLSALCDGALIAFSDTVTSVLLKNRLGLQQERLIIQSWNNQENINESSYLLKMTSGANKSPKIHISVAVIMRTFVLFVMTNK